MIPLLLLCSEPGRERAGGGASTPHRGPAKPCRCGGSSAPACCGREPSLDPVQWRVNSETDYAGAPQSVAPRIAVPISQISERVKYWGHSKSPTNGFPSRAPATGQLRVGVRSSVTGEMGDDAFVMSASARGDALGTETADRAMMRHAGRHPEPHPREARRQRRVLPYTLFFSMMCMPCFGGTRYDENECGAGR